MDNLKNKKNIILIAVVLLVVLAIAGWQYYAKFAKQKLTGTGGKPSETAAEKVSPTREEVPTDIKIPEVGEQVSDKSIAVPKVVTEAAPGVSAKLRIFDIKAENNKFEPSTIIAKIGDTVHVNFTAVDKTYDITFPDYGMKQTANKGETKILGFQAVSEGKFTYYCESCGGLNSNVKGYIIIVAK